MRQTFKQALFKLLLAIFVISATIGLGVPASSKPVTEETTADLVVYGKIFTAEENQLVEAMAVKDGRYIYVGDKKGAEALVKQGRTEVLDYNGQGLVMPGCGNGHAHYMLGYALKTIGTTVDFEADAHKFMTEILPKAVKKARATGATTIFGHGWNFMNFEKNLPNRQQLDAICSDIPIYFLDDECHK
ncbi:MAG: hypothetical protein IJS50_00015, partial [Desulfovibrio sp.]|nr:hypothetical protein [Desulfovibrio sp.]